MGFNTLISRSAAAPANVVPRKATLECIGASWAYRLPVNHPTLVVLGKCVGSLREDFRGGIAPALNTTSAVKVIEESSREYGV